MLLLDLTCAVVVGVTLGKLFALFLSWKPPLLVTAAIVPGSGYGVYEAADLIKNWSAIELGFEVYIEPLLATLIAGVVVDIQAAYLGGLDDLPDTVVAMSGDDRAALELCEAAHEAGVERTVARITRSELLDRFHAVGTLVIDVTRAAVALFEDAVRTPDAADLVLHNDATRQSRQIPVRARHLKGRAVRDLRLPAGVLVLAIRRNGTTMTPDGFTTLRRGDELTVIGTPALLREVDSRLSETPAPVGRDGRVSRRRVSARRNRQA